MPEVGRPAAHISESVVWPPGLSLPFGGLASLGCPLGRSLPRLPVGWRGLARGLCTYLPMVVHPGSTQLLGFERLDCASTSVRLIERRASGCYYLFL